MSTNPEGLTDEQFPPSHPARTFVRAFLEIANDVQPIDTVGRLLRVTRSATAPHIDEATLCAAMAIEGELFWEGRQS